MESTDVTQETGKTKKKRTVLDQFINLKNPNDKIRIKSTLNILKYLNQDDTDTKDNELKYALIRIIRGLGSSTNVSRVGYYTILVALLNTNESISVKQIFELVQKHLHKAGSNSKSENADISTGQILTNGAIIRSNMWFKISEEEKINVLSSIIAASKVKTYHGLLAYEFLINSFEKIDDQELCKICPMLEENLSKPLENYNLDSLYLAQSMKIKFPNLPKSVSSIIKYHEVTDEENLKNLCNILMIVPSVNAVQHPVYDLICAEFATSDTLHLFLDEVDKYLYTPNRNRLLVTVKMNTSILEHMKDPSNIPSILTRNFVHQTLNYFKTLKRKDQDVEFKQNVDNLFEKLLYVLKRENVTSKIKIAVLKKLLFSPGTFIFEKITHSKLIQNITWTLDVNGVKKLGKVYRGVIEGTEIIESQYGHNDVWLNNDKLYGAHLLIKLLNLKCMHEEVEWKSSVLIFLMELGILKQNKIQIGAELAGLLKTAFFGALDLKLPKVEELHKILLTIVQHLDTKLSEDNLENVLRNPISTDDYQIWQRALKIINKIEKKKYDGLRSVFLTLFLYCGLLLFDNSKLATDSAKELFVCYEKSKKSKRESVDLDDSQDDDLKWIEVVTDLFLNFLSHNSSLLRNMVNIVFRYLCEYMTPNTIHQLVSVLDPENEDPLTKNEDIDETDDESDDNDSDDEKSETEENEQSESEEEEEEVEEEEADADKLRMALHRVLSSHGRQSDEESIDIDQLSETEGEQLDKALAEAFKQFKPNRGKQKKQNEEQRTLTHFRVRVLDIIDIYLDSQPSMILTLEIMLPLLKAVEFSIRDEHQSPLLHRLKSSLKKLSNIKKFSNFEGVDDTIIIQLLQSLLDKGTKSNWIVQDMGEQISDCCIFIIRCSDILINNDETGKKVKKHLFKSVKQLISNELENFFNKRDSVTPVLFFKKLVQISWDGNLHILPCILRHIFDDNIKLYRKTQAVEMALLFYSNQRYLSSKPDEIKIFLNESHVEFSNSTITLFKNLCEASIAKSVTDKFLCQMFKLLSTMKCSSTNLDTINWSEIADNVREYRSTASLSKDAKSAFNKLCSCLRVSNVVQMKPKVNLLKQTEGEEVSKVQPDNRKIAKKTKNKETLKQKKESKQLRLQSLSEGLKDIDFGTVVDDEMETDGGEEESSKNTSKKRKNSEEAGYENGSIKKKKKNSDADRSGGKYIENGEMISPIKKKTQVDSDGDQCEDAANENDEISFPFKKKKSKHNSKIEKTLVANEINGQVKFKKKK